MKKKAAKKNVKKKTRKTTAPQACDALCSPVACRSVSTRGEGHPCTRTRGHRGIHNFECMTGAVAPSAPTHTEKTEPTQPKPKEKRIAPVSPIQNAINHLERRGYDVQYLCKDTYRIQRDSQPYYFSTEALIVLASHLDTPDAFAEMLQTGIRQTRYTSYLAAARPTTEATNGMSSTRTRTPSRKANRAAVISDGTLPAWKQKVLERASTQEVIAKINAATSAKPLAESDLDAKYELRLAKIAASAGVVQMQTRGDVTVFFAKG